MSKLIKGTHHIALKCNGPEMFAKTMEFYHEILGLEIIRTWADGANAMVSTGDALLEIFTEGRCSDTTGTVNHIALATDDTDACIEAVRAAGYTITMEPKDIVIGSVPPFPARIGFCIGPVGEEVEFFCEK